jgi:hypothetical protein
MMLHGKYSSGCSFAARRHDSDSGGISTTAILVIVGVLLVVGVLVVAGIVALGIAFFGVGAWAVRQAHPQPEIAFDQADLPPQFGQPNNVQVDLNVPAVPAQKGPDAAAQQFIAKNLGPNDRAGALAPNSPLWARVRQAVENRQFRAAEMVGGGFGNVPFAESPAEGGVLIGFFVAEDDGGHIGFLQPIYLTAKGEKVGHPYGTPLKKPVQCFKAKPGHVVGGFHARTGGVMDALAVVFMKVEGEKLSPGDNYSSIQVGGQGGGPGTYASTGPLVIGIHGRRIERDGFSPAGSVSGMGMILMP